MPMTERINREAAIKKVRQMEEIWEFAKKQMQGAQETQKRNADRHRREVDFQVGDATRQTALAENSVIK